jgi:hypothetical protein
MAENRGAGTMPKQLLIHEWDKVRTDRVTIREPGQTA